MGNMAAVIAMLGGADRALSGVGKFSIAMTITRTRLG
jgi:hypothetical protein